jgi:AcrR family transcriptional regulator
MEGRTSPRPRERIVSTARELFHKYGIGAVSIDTIAETAGTNKTTLYRHFASKEDLILECLRSGAEKARLFWTETEASSPEDGFAQLRFWVKRIATNLADDCRGCEFENVAVELAEEDHPVRKFIADFKGEYRSWLARLCREAGVARAKLLADTLFVLLNGVLASRRSMGPEGPSSQFQTMAEAVIDSFRRGAKSSTRKARRVIADNNSNRATFRR